MPLPIEGSAARRPERLTLRTAFDSLYLSWSPDLSPATIARYRYDLQRWERELGDLYVTEISTPHFQRYRTASRQRGDSARTTETTVRTVKQILAICRAEGIIKNQPHTGKARRIPAPQPHVPSIEQLDLLYRAAAALKWPRCKVGAEVWWKSLLCVAWVTGLRREDLYWRLEWRHVQPDCLAYQAGKTGKHHLFPMLPVLRRHLNAMRPHSDTSIFAAPRNLRGIRENLRDLSRIAGIDPPLTSQGLRQCAVNIWAAADGKAGDIIQGAALPGATRHYLDTLRYLQSVADDLEFPPAMLDFGRGGERQLELF